MESDSSQVVRQAYLLKQKYTSHTRAHPASYKMGTGSPFRGYSGRSVALPLQFKAKVKETVELYLYCLFAPSWAVLGKTSPLHLTHSTFYTANYEITHRKVAGRLQTKKRGGLQYTRRSTVLGKLQFPFADIKQNDGKIHSCWSLKEDPTPLYVDLHSSQILRYSGNMLDIRVIYTIIWFKE